MPRGNDSQAALVDLRGEYGAASGNAEDLIAASRHSQSPELRQALLQPRDNEGTVKLLDSDDPYADIQKKLDISEDEGTVIDAAVRGGVVVAVVEVESGRTYKVTAPASDFNIKTRGVKARAVEESEEDAATREAHLERMQVEADAARARQEAEQAAQDAAEKAREAQQKRAKKDD
jgi:hypothetical protein